jgi:hypothetical protein
MNNDQRVLGRQGARELTPDEANNVSGGFTTLLSVCSRPLPGMSGCDPDLSH